MSLRIVSGCLLIFVTLTAESCNQCVQRKVGEAKQVCRDAGENVRNCIRRAEDSIREACVTDANSIDSENDAGLPPDEMGLTGLETESEFTPEELEMFLSLDDETQSVLLGSYFDLGQLSSNSSK